MSAPSRQKNQERTRAFRGHFFAVWIALLAGAVALGGASLTQRLVTWEVPSDAVFLLTWIPRGVFALAILAGASAAVGWRRLFRTGTQRSSLSSYTLLILMFVVGPVYSFLQPEQWPARLPSWSILFPIAAVLLMIPGFIHVHLARAAVSRTRTFLPELAWPLPRVTVEPSSSPTAGPGPSADVQQLVRPGQRPDAGAQAEISRAAAPRLRSGEYHLSAALWAQLAALTERSTRFRAPDSGEAAPLETLRYALGLYACVHRLEEGDARLGALRTDGIFFPFEEAAIEPQPRDRPGPPASSVKIFCDDGPASDSAAADPSVPGRAVALAAFRLALLEQNQQLAIMDSAGHVWRLAL